MSLTAPFEHRLNLVVGGVRILWGTLAIDRNGQCHPHGWVLPGGRRTDDEAEARAAAAAIARYLGDE